MSADRVDIADAIIAGMAGGNDDLERLARSRKMLLAPGVPYGDKVSEEFGLKARADAWRKMLEAAL